MSLSSPVMVSVDAEDAVRCLVLRPPPSRLSLGRFLSFVTSPYDLIVFTEEVDEVRDRVGGKVKRGGKE